jgi:hypothetical protein
MTNAIAVFHEAAGGGAKPPPSHGETAYEDFPSPEPSPLHTRRTITDGIGALGEAKP